MVGPQHKIDTALTVSNLLFTSAVAEKQLDSTGTQWHQLPRNSDSTNAAGTTLRVHFNDCGAVGKQSFEVGSGDVIVTFRSGRTSIGQRGFILRLSGMYPIWLMQVYVIVSNKKYHKFSRTII
jgi:hypothetical protein